MELCIYLVAVLAFVLAVQADSTETSSQLPDDVNESYNPLADLVLHQNQNDIQPLSRVKRQYGYGPYRRYPYPLPIFVGLGGIGVGGYRGRGFGGRAGRGGSRGVAFGGRGFGGRGPSLAGRGIGGRGIGGRGIGGRGGGIGGGRGGGRG